MRQITAARAIWMILMGAFLYRSLIFLIDWKHEIKLRKKKAYGRAKKNRPKCGNPASGISLVCIFILLIFLMIRIYIRGA